MLFDFSTFTDIVRNTYCGEWPLSDCLRVFRWYFEAYESKTGRAHPNIKREQIQNILRRMPTLGGYRPEEEIDAGLYVDLITRYFSAPILKCDYNINHFFSGRVRELRYMERLSDLHQCENAEL